MHYLTALVRKPLASITTFFCLAILPALFPATGRAQQCATPQFPQWKTFNVGAQPAAIVKADFNADGKLDVAATNILPGEVSVLLGDGAGGFSAPSKFSIPSSPVAITTADFNGDEKADIAAANINSSTSPSSLTPARAALAPRPTSQSGLTMAQSPSAISTATTNSTSSSPTNPRPHNRAAFRFSSVTGPAASTRGLLTTWE